MGVRLVLMASQIVFLMYHELEMPGRALCQREPGYTRYVLPLDDFRITRPAVSGASSEMVVPPSAFVRCTILVI